MAEIMDPFANEYELLSRGQLPPGFDSFSAGAGATNMDQLDDYLRAIGALPPRPPNNVAPAPTSYNYAATAAAPLWGALDYDTNLPGMFGPYAAGFDDHVQQFGAAEFHAAPPAPASDNDADMELHSSDYLDTAQGGQADPPARAVLVQWMCECSEQYILDDGTVHCTVTQTFGTTLALMPAHAPEQVQTVTIEELTE